MRLALVYLALLLFCGLFAPVFSPYDPLETNTEKSLSQPSVDHPFGTDLLGRDIVSRILYGIRHTLFVSIFALSIAVIIGSMLGLIPALFGDWIISFTLIVISGLLAFPYLVMSLVILTVLGQGTLTLAIAVGISQIAHFAQITLATFSKVHKMEYMVSAQAIGASRIHLLFKYYLPNMQPVLLGYMSVILSACIFNSVALSFLGIGASLETPDLGTILSEGRNVLFISPAISFVPGLIIFGLIISLNTVFDKLSMLSSG